VCVHRVEVTDEVRAIDTLAGPDYAAAWDVAVAGADALSAEQWARATFEGAPRVLRDLIVAGWIGGLGLKLAPRSSGDHVLGWSITRNTPELIILEAKFRFGTSHNVLRVEKSRVLLATFVRNEKRGGRTVWTLVAPLHQQILPRLLGRAVSHRRHPEA
jgi:hypothetical protein